MMLLAFAFWVGLNGRLTLEIAGLGAGIAVLAFVFLCACCEWSPDREKKLYRAVPLLTAYAGTVLWQIIKANLALCKVVYAGRPEPVVRVIRTKLRTRFAKMLLANSITLTPGTVTLSCEGDELVVHCLTPRMAEGLEDNIFERKLVKMEAALHG